MCHFKLCFLLRLWALNTAQKHFKKLDSLCWIQIAHLCLFEVPSMVHSVKRNVNPPRFSFSAIWFWFICICTYFCFTNKLLVILILLTLFCFKTGGLVCFRNESISMFQYNLYLLSLKDMEVSHFTSLILTRRLVLETVCHETRS